MPRVAIHPSAVMAGLLRKKREEHGLTLREVGAEAARLGEEIPYATLAKIERGEADPGVRRLHLLLKIYSVPAQYAADLVDLEQLAGERPKTTDLRALGRQGTEHWRAGDVRRALACFMAVREAKPKSPEDELTQQKALLAFASVADTLGKHALAQRIVEDLLRTKPDPSLLAMILLRGAISWGHQGVTELALAYLDRAEAHVARGDAATQAQILHTRASMCLEAGELDEAEDAIARARLCYRKAKDGYGEHLLASLRIDLLRRRGDWEQALKAAQEERRSAERDGHARLVVLRSLDVAGALLELRQPAEAIQTLNDALAAAVGMGDDLARFLAHHARWKAYEQLGDRIRAEAELGAAQSYVKFVEGNLAQADEVRRTLMSARRRRRAGRRPVGPGPRLVASRPARKKATR